MDQGVVDILRHASTCADEVVCLVEALNRAILKARDNCCIVTLTPRPAADGIGHDGTSAAVVIISHRLRLPEHPKAKT